MFWVVIEEEGLFYYWGEYDTLKEASDEFNKIRKTYPDLCPLVTRKNQVELEGEDSWYLRDFC